MKKFLIFIAPFLIAVLIFFIVLFFVNRKTGKGALLITSVPQSNVFMDGILVGKTPFCMATETCKNQEGINAGDHNLKLVPIDGIYPDYDTKITVNNLTLMAVDEIFGNNGESNGTIIGLSPLATKNDVQIQVISIPDKANVFLDGNPVGITPLLLRQVSESDHDLRLTLDSYQDKILKIKTALGFQLNALVFLGIKSDLSNLSVASTSATEPIIPVVSKVLILDTPTGFLRVRESNSVSSAEIAKIKPGELYELVNEKDSWFEIKLSSSEAKLGWISSQYAVKK